MPFLGHVIFCEGIKVDPQKVKAIKKWPKLTTLTDIRCFLGLPGYYRRFDREFLFYCCIVDKVDTKKG